MDGLREKLDLFIPDNGFPSDKELNYYLEAQRAVSQFCRGELPPSEFLERLHGYGVNMDSYADCVEFNLNH